MTRQSKFLVLVCGLALVGAACRKPQAATHVQRGNKYAEDARYPEAMLEFRAALQADPKLGDVRMKLGDLYMRAGDEKNALREYVRAADLLPERVEAQLKAGALLLIARSFNDAKAAADRALQLDPKNVNAQILRGNALAMLKDLDGAVREYQEAIALDPSQNAAYENLGAIQLAKGERQEAEDTFKKAVASSPSSIAARLALANFFCSTRRPAECEATLKEALQIDPKGLGVNRALGALYMVTGRVDEAEQYFSFVGRATNTVPALLSLVDFYVAVKRLDEARTLLRDVAARKDGFAPANVRLAAIEASQGSRTQAEVRLREVLDKQPNDSSALLLNGRLLLLDGKRAEALAAAKVVIAVAASAPVAAQAHALAGLVYTAGDRIEDAVAAYEEVLKLEPQPLNAQLALARLNLALGNSSKAKTYAQQALAIQPSNPESQSLLIRSDLMAGQVASAKANLEPLQRAFPNSWTVANLTALVHLAEKHPEAAHTAYERALQLAPDDYEALSGVVQIELASGRSKEATTRIEARLARTQPSVEVTILAARTYATVHDFEKAEALLLKAVELDPAGLQAYGLLGSLYASQDRLEEAKERFRDLLKRNPKSVPANTMLATLLERQGRMPDAEQEYRRVLAMAPDAVVAANNLAWRYAATNRNLDEALQLAQTAYQRLPGDPTVNDTLGWVYYRKNMAAKAVPYLEKSAQKVPDRSTYQYHLGMAYVQSGNFVGARRALQQALTLEPNFEGAAEARKALEITGK